MDNLDKICYYTGAIVVGLLIGLVVVAIAYYVAVGLKVGRLWLINQNWFNFYIERHIITSEKLRKNYKVWWIVKKPGNKEYILRYRLRNIKIARRHNES